MNPLLEQFLLEARENLAFIDQNLESIGSDDPELLNSVFRAAHTLKGGSGIVGFDGIKRITHHAEDMLDMLRSGKLEFRAEMIESLYNAFDEVVNLVEAAEEVGDVVDADESRVEQIASELSAMMGKSTQKAAWSCPFAFAKSEMIANLSIRALKNYEGSLEFSYGTKDEQFCTDRHLYAVVLDIDENCMLYGNDPLFTLSLFGEKLIGIYSYMSHDVAKSIISGMDDLEGLALKLPMVAFIDSTYDDINDVLFNFSDELLYYPLDIATLLGVSNGASGYALDILKEFAISYEKEMAQHGDIINLIDNTLLMIGQETLQSHQLKRLREVLRFIREEDLVHLKGFVDCLANGVVYVHSEMQASYAGAVASVQDIQGRDEKVLSKEAKIQLKEIFAQQLMLLESNSDDASFARVKAILGGNIKNSSGVYIPDFASREDAIEWLRDTAQGKQKAEAVEQVAAPVETLVAQEAVYATVDDKSQSAAVLEPVEPEVFVPQAQEMAAEPAVEMATESKTAQKIDAGDSEAALVKKSVIGKTVKIEQESIDSLMNIVGELLVAKNSLPYLADNVYKMTFEQIKRSIMEKYTSVNRLTEQLQDLIMSMRMLPISYVFDRYPKLVRDISKNLGKKVSLTMDGGETKLDKNMIEMLADPMIHIMRNSLDHGIESPEVRVKKGKDEQGHISLNAYAQSDKIIVEIKDDGAGINIDRVIQKVLEKNLLTIEQIDAMSNDEKAMLVMLPGLSTAESISEYSGRGVGMDVVKKSIENFGGSIAIKTVANRGTTITLAIPVSLAVTGLLHVTMNSVHYGFPMESVSETVKIDASEIKYLQNEPFVSLRGEVIPLMFTKGMLDEASLAGKTLPVVVLNIKGNALAVVVNELLGQLDVVQKPLEGIMKNHPIFSGTALLGNGQIIVAIDPIGMLSISNQFRTSQKAAS